MVKVMVDNVSSTDILFKDASRRMGIDGKHFKPYEASLVGFNGEEAHSLGSIDIQIIVGIPPHM